MHKKMKGRQRKAAAIILTAALVLSAGPVPSVLAETERFFGDRTAGDTGRRKHGTRDAGNGSSGRDRTADRPCDGTEYRD